MIYQYRCDECKIDFDVIKGAVDYNKDEFCKSGHLSRKVFSIMRPVIDHSRRQYCPIVKAVVKNNTHRRQIAKEKGMIEMGNECPNKTYERMEKEREKTLSKRYDD